MAFVFHRNGMTPKVIEVAEPGDTVAYQDLYNAIREYQALPMNMDLDEVAVAAGQDDLGGGVKTALTVSLSPEWQVRFWEGVDRGFGSGGNLIGGYEGRPLEATPYSGDTVKQLDTQGGVMVATGSGVTQQDKEDIAEMVWDEPEAAEVATSGELVPLAKSTELAPLAQSSELGSLAQGAALAAVAADVAEVKGNTDGVLTEVLIAQGAITEVAGQVSGVQAVIDESVVPEIVGVQAVLDGTVVPMVTTIAEAVGGITPSGYRQMQASYDGRTGQTLVTLAGDQLVAGAEVGRRVRFVVGGHMYEVALNGTNWLRAQGNTTGEQDPRFEIVD